MSWSTSYPDASYKVSRQSAFCFGRSQKKKKKKKKKDFQDGSHLRFLIGTILAFFFHLPHASCQVSHQFAFRLRSEKHIFKMVAIAAILDFGSNDFCRFLLLKTPQCFLSSFKSIGLSFQEKRKTDFQDSNNGGHPGVSIGTICAIFIFIYVTLMIPIKIHVIWPFGWGEAQNRFSGLPPSWNSDRNNFSYFWSKSKSNASYKFPVNLSFRSGEAKNRF